MSLKFKYDTYKVPWDEGGGERGYVEIEGLEKGSELTAEEAMIVLLGKINDSLLRIARNTSS